MLKKELVCIKRNFKKFGYVVKEELWYHGENDKNPTIMISAYNLDGDYIGSSKVAYRLCQKRGIKPEKANPSHTVCSVGFSQKEQAWYGWSHRAIYGFKIGHTIQWGHVCQDKFGIGYVAKTLDDCKALAIEFAESVS